MSHVPTLAPVVISLPIADRRTSCAFYREAFGLEPVGEPADDGVPEPLLFDVDGARVMLVPSGGFGWVIGDHRVAEPGTSECVLSLTVGSGAAVDELISRAAHAGATVVTPPGTKPWGYTGTVADPDGHLWMVACAGPRS